MARKSWTRQAFSFLSRFLQVLIGLPGVAAEESRRLRRSMRADKR